MRSAWRSIVGALTFAISSALPFAWPEPAAAATIYRPPHDVSHAATCTASSGNDTNNINSWLAALRTKPGDVIQFAHDQCYRTDKTVMLYQKSHLTFDGNGATFESFRDDQMRRDNPHMEIEDDTSVTVKNLAIRGHAPGGYRASLEAQHGFYVVGGSGITIENVKVNAVYGDFVALQNDAKDGVPTNVTIEQSQFGEASTGNGGAGRQELTIDDGQNVLVQHNYFGHGSRSAVDIEPTSTRATIRNITIEKNTWGPNPNYWFADIGKSAVIRAVHFVDNTLDRTLGVDVVDPSTTNNRTDYEFIGNVSSTKQATGNCENGAGETMRIIGVSSLTIKSNTQRMETPTQNTCQYLVNAQRVVGATISGNYLQNAWKVGKYDAASLQVCEGKNYIGPNNPPTQVAPLDPPATRCPGS